MPANYQDEYFYSLQCGFSEESRLFQLVEQPEPALMFHQDYAFFSGTSQRMKNHFADFANQVIENGYLSSPSPFIVELGSNDGIFLTHFEKMGVRHLGPGVVEDHCRRKGGYAPLDN